jgi:hypothetical protein
MSKYTTKYCTVFEIPTDPRARTAHFFDVTIALGSWDEQEDAEDESIFYYMDNEPLEVGVIISDGFLVTHIEEVTE